MLSVWFQEGSGLTLFEVSCYGAFYGDLGIEGVIKPLVAWAQRTSKR